MDDNLNNINKLIVNNKVLANLDAIPEYMSMDLFMTYIGEVFPIENISFDDIDPLFIYNEDTVYYADTYEIEPLTFEKFLKILISGAESRPVNLRAARRIGSDTITNGISPPVEMVSNTNVEYYLINDNTTDYVSHYTLFMTTKLPGYINAIEYKLIIGFDYNATNNTIENLGVGSATSREETNGAAAHILMIPNTSWVANTMSTTLTGLDFVTLSSIILVTPTPESADKYANSGIMCTAQGDGTLTFTCNVLPTETIYVNCVVF